MLTSLVDFWFYLIVEKHLASFVTRCGAFLGNSCNINVVVFEQVLWFSLKLMTCTLELSQGKAEWALSSL